MANEKHISFSELWDTFVEHNRKNGITSQFEDNKRLVGVVVFKPESWPGHEYTLEERSYKVVSDNKAFIPGMGGNSIFGECLDGVDRGVRLDWYMKSDRPWKVDFCYLLE